MLKRFAAAKTPFVRYFCRKFFLDFFSKKGPLNIFTHFSHFLVWFLLKIRNNGFKTYTRLCFYHSWKIFYFLENASLS